MGAVALVVQSSPVVITAQLNCVHREPWERHCSCRAACSAAVKEGDIHLSSILAGRSLHTRLSEAISSALTSEFLLIFTPATLNKCDFFLNSSRSLFIISQIRGKIKKFFLFCFIKVQDSMFWLAVIRVEQRKKIHYFFQRNICVLVLYWEVLHRVLSCSRYSRLMTSFAHGAPGIWS